MNTLNRAKQLQDRTKKFAVRIIKAFAGIPKDEAARIIEPLMSECEELLKIFSASLATAKRNR
jgi:hypothetical protein